MTGEEAPLVKEAVWKVAGCPPTCLTKGAGEGDGRNDLECWKRLSKDRGGCRSQALHCFQAWRLGGGTVSQSGSQQEKPTQKRTQEGGHTKGVGIGAAGEGSLTGC